MAGDATKVLALNYKLVASIFVVLTVAFGASTGYLLAYPAGAGGSGYASTRTIVSTSISTIVAPSVSTILTTSLQTATVTGAGFGGYSVGIAFKSGVGFYLTDGSGSTLYYRTKDIQSNGTSTCTGGCLQAWPVFFTANLVLPPGLNASAFKTMLRGDGKMQLTYDGWPLYYFAEDHKPGDTLGQGIGGIWFAYSLHDSAQATTTSASTTSGAAVSSATSAATSTSTTSTTSVASATSASSTSTTTSVSTSSTPYKY